eukprot:TRINITY_DN8877_c0_g1_i1.p1 TRINITY_DN8877_c0_g1~~TRINITY_DN8877_c0_g1_i1.p1  ORF type:complete len:297 (-),score=44.33 TRINITY_DN8877_c0_g1_i1:39-929(-)
MYGVLTERLGPLCRVPREIEVAEMGPVIANRYVRPSPRSFHESTLDPATWKLPTINRLDDLQNSLQRDRFRQAAVYKDSAKPSSARFNVELPRTPQHTKYCHKPTTSSSQVHEQEPASLTTPTSEKSCSRAASRPGTGTSETKFSIRTLREMFLQFGGGDAKITHRRLIVMLQKKSDFVDKLMQYSEDNWHQNDPDFNMPQKKKNDNEHTSRLRGQIYKFKQVLHELDGDGNGQMEWEEFVEFFRRCGLLLEYKSDAFRNHTSFDVLSLELMAKRASDAGDRMGSRDSGGYSDGHG